MGGVAGRGKVNTEIQGVRDTGGHAASAAAEPKGIVNLGRGRLFVGGRSRDRLVERSGGLWGGHGSAWLICLHGFSGGGRGERELIGGLWRVHPAGGKIGRSPGGIKN